MRSEKHFCEYEIVEDLVFCTECGEVLEVGA